MLFRSHPRCRTSGMQDRKDAVQEECRTGGIQDMSDLGQEGCRKVEIVRCMTLERWDAEQEGFKPGKLERKYLGREGFRTGGIHERRETGKEGPGQEVCGTGDMLDTGQEAYRKGGMQNRWDAGLEGCKKGGMQPQDGKGAERRDA